MDYPNSVDWRTKSAVTSVKNQVCLCTFAFMHSGYEIHYCIASLFESGTGPPGADLCSECIQALYFAIILHYHIIVHALLAIVSSI